MAFEAEFQDEGLRKMLIDMQKHVDDFSKRRKNVMGLIAANVFADVMEHFQREEGPSGKWEKWSRTYSDYMDRIGRGNNKKLQWSGHLRQNFKPTSYRNMADGVVFYNNAKTKSGAPYAFYHDEGSGPIPQRQFMWLSSKKMSKIESELLQFVMGDS